MLISSKIIWLRGNMMAILRKLLPIIRDPKDTKEKEMPKEKEVKEVKETKEVKKPDYPHNVYLEDPIMYDVVVRSLRGPVDKIFASCVSTKKKAGAVILSLTGKEMARIIDLADADQSFKILEDVLLDGTNIKVRAMTIEGEYKNDTSRKVNL